jgi:hypothetical protein
MVIKARAAHKTSIAPQGGNTGFWWWAPFRMRRVRQVPMSLERRAQSNRSIRENLSITVQAGCVLQEIQEAAEAGGGFLPLSLGSEGQLHHWGQFIHQRWGHASASLWQYPGFVLGPVRVAERRLKFTLRP